MSSQRTHAAARRRPAPGRRRALAAFTLLEMAVVVALSSVLFVVLAQWVMSLSATASGGTDTAIAQRDASYVDSLLRADTEASRGCDPNGQDAPLRDLQPDAAQLYVEHTDADGVPDPTAPVDLVLWRLSGANLQRAVLTGDGSCSFDVSTASWTTVASGVRAAAGQNPFTGTGNRQAAPGAAPYYGDCTGMNAENCLDDGLQTSLVFVSPGPSAATVPLSTDYQLNTTGSGL